MNYRETAGIGGDDVAAKDDLLCRKIEGEIAAGMSRRNVDQLHVNTIDHRGLGGPDVVGRQIVHQHLVKRFIDGSPLGSAAEAFTTAVVFSCAMISIPAA